MDNKKLESKKSNGVLIYLSIVIVLLIIWMIVFVNRKEKIETSLNNKVITQEENIKPLINSSMPEAGLDRDKIFELDKKKAGTKIYYSERLGVGFTYLLPANDLVDGFKISEAGNKINLGDQSVEIFIKNPKATLEEAIKDTFLRNYDSKDCFVVINEKNEQALPNYVSAEIAFPPTSDQEEPWWQNSEKCPPNYSKTNGIQYFLMNKDVPGKFMFVKIGQYSAAADGTEGPEEINYNWTHSIRVIK